MNLNDFKSPQDNASERRIRIFFLGAIFSAGMAICLLQLFFLQIVNGQSYRDRSAKISQRSQPILAQRGEIYDRNVDSPLAVNEDSFAVDVIPGEIPAELFDTVAAKLAAFLEIKKAEIDKKVPPDLRRSFASIEIKSNLDFSTITKIAENSVDLPGVSWRSKPVRKYLCTNSFSHILGYVGNINSDELKLLYNKGYKNNSVVGKQGVEKQYDEILQGTDGTETRAIDVRGRFLPEPPSIKPPVMGNSLVLTIDSRIQTLVEETLGNRVGAAVVLKPSTGEILAMASYPYFDSNEFISDTSGAAYRRVEGMPNSPLINRAINSAYPPASTFKVISTVALLNEKLIPPEKKIQCKWLLSYGGRDFHCHVGFPGHGNLNLRDGLAQSCNVYFWTVGRDYLGVDKLSSYAESFGYGKSPEIDLPLLSSSAGTIPNPVWKERRLHEKWLGGDTLNMSIGQGFTAVTPLQVADMMAMIVNEGKIYKPHILKEVRNSATGEVVESVEREILREAEIPSSVWKEVKSYLRYTVTDGSAMYPMKNRRIQIAGKTGTGEDARFRNKQWHSWFVGFAPYDAPSEEQIVVAVLVEAVNVWEWWAPYATNIIFQGIFANQSFDEAIDSLGFRNLKKPIGRQE